MRIAVIAAALALVGLAPAALADLPVATTTLARETANNTSAADTFATQADGNLGAGNVSKVPVRSLLYAGSTTLVYAHVEPWWGSSHHINIGYSSQDPAQVHRQIEDMISRGFDGLAADWYGPDSYEATGLKLIMAEAELHPGFGFFVEIDQGAVEWDSCYPTCTATTAFIQLATRVANDFFSSPAYTRLGGRPVLREFGISSFNVDWNAVQAQVPGNPLIIHRNTGAFTIAQTGGAFAWIEPLTLSNEPAGYDGTDYLNDFYAKATSTYPTQIAFGSVFKGFNDIVAPWAPTGGRHIEQNCGRTWLHTFSTLNQYYSASRQLPVLQAVTWNDYEEGTEIESGIDNCVTVTAGISGTQLTWAINGDESTVDHYTVFISTDGQNLASVGDFAAGVHATDLGTLTLPAGSYTLYVKAIGKPSLRNQMSAPVAYGVTTGGGSGSTTKTISIDVAPGTQSVKRGGAATFTLSIAETGASDPVTLACSAPTGVTCALSQNTVTPAAGAASVQLTVSSAAQSSRRGAFPLSAFWALGALGFVACPTALSRKRRWAVVALFSALALMQLSCGGPSQVAPAPVLQPAVTTQPAAPPAPTTYTVTVSATSGTVVKSANVSITVN